MLRDTGVIVKFRGEDLTLHIGRYAGEFRNIALVLMTELGEPYLKASINPPMNLPSKWVAIKDWSENKGVMEALCDTGVIRKHGHSIDTGYVTAPICVVSDRIWELLYESTKYGL
ncbi:hypothetical protein KC573_00285 [candidate division WWE3 bacterium]|uniref:Uncharacterized protein n=1 Tax=candidate division WWE3 bacterium TaxID=2053526 RepID=A0A955LW11_UNCKA|nr:hypothetical protein [candidate division WWE3 bacterium]